MTHVTPRSSVVSRTTALCVLLVLSPLLLTVPSLPAPTGAGVQMPFLLLTALFLCGAMLVFHVEFRGQTHSFTLTEVPLVLGLFLVSPVHLLLARLLGQLIALALMPRQPVLKVALNASLWIAETTVALLVVRLLRDPDAADPWSWVAVCAAVLAADAVSVLVVHVVIRWHGADPVLRTVAVAAGATCIANTCLGLAAVLLIQVHVAAVGVLAVLSVVVFSGYRAYASLHQRHASLRLLHEFTEALDGTTKPEEVIAAMLDHARTLLRADLAELLVLPADGQPDVRISKRGDQPAVRATMGLVEPFAQELSRRPSTVRVARGAKAPGGAAEFLEGVSCRDGMLTVMQLNDDTRLVLVVGGRPSDVGTFDVEDERLFETLASHAGMALQKGHLIDELRAEALRREHQAMHDALTGLPNRLRFHEHAHAAIADAEAGGDSVAVLLMDLDGFKEINDTLGHHTGDELLQEVGRRLLTGVRDGDVAARLGGDEFAVLLRIAGPPSADDPLSAATRLLEIVEEVVQLNGLALDVRASVGVAVWPEHGQSTQELLQRADVAMYEAKAEGSRVTLYDPTRDHHSTWRLQLASELRKALDEDQLVVHYQPKADLRNGEITSVEALVRWEHPEMGRIQPDQFISVAEQSGLITPLTYAVLERAARDCVSWRRVGIDIGIAVNVSARSLLEPDFVARVMLTLRRAGLSTQALTLELTESSIMGDTRRTLDVLGELAAAGIAFSVDDFGTGYSSLAYLQKLPVCELKVDRSFVFELTRDASNQAIVRSVVELGHSLGLSVVAEGVENQVTWDLLLSMGCDVAQGYLLSAALPASELVDWLLRRRAFASAQPTELAALPSRRAVTASG